MFEGTARQEIQTAYRCQIHSIAKAILILKMYGKSLLLISDWMVLATNTVIAHDSPERPLTNIIHDHMTSSFFEKWRLRLFIQKRDPYFENKMESYDYGHIVSTDAWQNMLFEGFHYTGSNG